MKHYVYKITNNINNKFYIGKRTCKTSIENDSYMGSGDLIKLAIKKYGIENFTKEILKEFDTEQEAYDYEAVLVTEDFVLSSENYNIALGGGTPQVPRVRTFKDVVEFQKEIKEEYTRLYYHHKAKMRKMVNKDRREFYKEVKLLNKTSNSVAWEFIIDTFNNLVLNASTPVYNYYTNINYKKAEKVTISERFLRSSYKYISQKQAKALAL